LPEAVSAAIESPGCGTEETEALAILHESISSDRPSAALIIERVSIADMRTLERDFAAKCMSTNTPVVAFTAHVCASKHAVTVLVMSI
jgi:hypothetical protein